MADTKITVLGMTGSGKTCYLLGFYYKMGSGMKGYTITTDDDTDVELRDRYAKMCDSSLGAARFPTGTDNISKYLFYLQYGYNTIMSFDWIDYPGGVLDRKNEGNLEEYESIKKSINDSSCLFICVDGELPVGNDIDEKIDKVKDNCSSVINTFFSDYTKTKNKIPPTAIIITKYDLCKDDTDENELCEIIEEAFSPFFIKDNDNIKRIVTIIPVSIGNNIMNNDCGGKLKPINIHLPIFMGIWFALSDKIEMYAKEIVNISSKNNEKINDLINQKAREENRFFKNRREIHRLANAINLVKNNDEKQHLEMSTILNIMENNSGKLLKELDTIPYIFVNSERKDSFSEILGYKEVIK